MSEANNSNSAIFPDDAVSHGPAPLPLAGPAPQTLIIDNSGAISGAGGDDIFYLNKDGQWKLPQIHAYGAWGDDTFYIDAAVGSKHDTVAGSHIFGGQGNNTYIFRLSSAETSRSHGRIDDFDRLNDRIFVERDGGSLIEVDLLDPPEGVRIVSVHGQQAILIDEKALYILEGARAMTSVSNKALEGGSLEERHFINWPAGWLENGVPKTADVDWSDTHNWAPVSMIGPHMNLVQARGNQGGHETPPLETLGTSGHDYLLSTNNQQRDILYGLGGDDLIVAGKGDDTLYGGIGSDTLYGGTDRDVLFGGDGKDLLRGGTEADKLFGGRGTDTLHGDEGSDSLYGDQGTDLLYAGSGDDVLFGGSGADTIFGGGGHDLLDGGSGQDFMYGGNGADTLRGGSARDHIEGGSGNDLIYGNSGNDRLYGGTGGDTIHGGSGNDKIYGGAGADLIYGGNGADLIDGGEGHDTLYGGAGSDIFVLGNSSRFDVIADFQPGLDKIGLGELSSLYGVPDPYASGYLRVAYDASAGGYKALIYVGRGAASGGGTLVAEAVSEDGSSFTLSHTDFTI